MGMKRITAILISIMILAMFLSGCGSSSREDVVSTETAETVAASDEITVEEAVSEEGSEEAEPEAEKSEGDTVEEDLPGEDATEEDASNESSSNEDLQREDLPVVEAPVEKATSEKTPTEDVPDGENLIAVPAQRDSHTAYWERRQREKAEAGIDDKDAPIPEPESQKRGWNDFGFAGGMLVGAIAGAILFALIKMLVSAVKKSGKGLHMEGAVVQGLGSRETQQDTIYLSDTKQYARQGLLMVVADGMGGLQNGGFISRSAASAAASTFAKNQKNDPERLVVTMVQNATNAVNVLLTPNYGAGGTTLIVAMIYMGKLYFSAVGDSRLCLYRDGDLIQLNRPHVFEEELLLRSINGEMSYDAARTYEKKGALTSYLGMGPLKYFDFPMYHIPLKKGDRVIAMSDGIFNTLTDKEIGAIIRKKPAEAAEELTKKVEKKQQRYQDNYSAVLVAVK